MRKEQPIFNREYGTEWIAHQSSGRETAPITNYQKGTTYLMRVRNEIGWGRGRAAAEMANVIVLSLMRGKEGTPRHRMYRFYKKLYFWFIWRSYNQCDV